MLEDLGRPLKMLGAPDGGLDPVRNLDLPVDIVDMGLDCVGANKKLAGNMFIGGAGSNPHEYLFFPWGQSWSGPF